MPDLVAVAYKARFAAQVDVPEDAIPEEEQQEESEQEGEQSGD